MNITDFRAHILKRLGAPILLVEITDDHIDTAIEDALEYFTEWSDLGTQRGMYTLDLVDGQQEYTLPSDIETVKYYLNGSTLYGLPSFRKLSYEQMLFNTNNLDLVGWVYSQANYSMTEKLLSPKYDFTFNKISHKLTMLDTMKVDQKIVLYVWRNLKTDYLEDIYDDNFFQRFATAYAKLQWSGNVGKYSSEMLSGRSLNYDDIRDQAEREIEELKRELLEDRNLQAGLFFG